MCLLYPFFSYIENYVQQHYQQHNDADDKKAARAIAKAFQNFHGTVVLALTVKYRDYTVKFIYSVKATRFCEIFTFLLSYVVPVKSKVMIS